MITELINALQQASPAEQAQVAQLLGPHMRNQLLSSPSIFGGGGDKLLIGQNVVLVNTLFNVHSGTVTIGDNTFFGHNCCCLTGTHDLAAEGIARQQAIPDQGRDIHIGKNCWIASNATILGPCTIGDNVVVAAGAVVQGGKLISGWIYGGVPAKPIRPVNS